MYEKNDIWGKYKGCGVRPIGHKGKYTRNTLLTWKKDELINYIECCEHNERVMAETLKQQANNFEKMLNDLILEDKTVPPNVLEHIGNEIADYLISNDFGTDYINDVWHIISRYAL